MQFVQQVLIAIGTTPLAWLQSIIKPIPKLGGNPINPSDYRGISLQSIVVKTLCLVMNSRLCDYLVINDMLAEEKNGFRAGMCCQDHMFALNTIVGNRKLLGKDTFAVFMHFKEVFDLVCRDLLWNKLQKE